MFGQLKAGVPLYVLNKDTLALSAAEVINVGHQTPVPFTAMAPGAYMQPPKTTIDVKIRVGDSTMDLQKLPTDAAMASFTDMIIAERREDLTSDVMAIRRNSQSVLESVEHHQELVTKCNQLLEDLNPQARAEAEHRREIDALGGRIENIEGMLAQLCQQLKREK